MKNAVYKVHRLFNNGNISFLDAPLWYQNLRKFIFDLRIHVFQNSNISISKPAIIPIPKEKGCTTMRPITHFELIDKLVLSITNKYLTQLFDKIFLPCSTAFRHRIGHI